MLEKIEMAERIAKTDSSVLLIGEAGVGKEFVAGHIHFKSNYASEPFVKVNCAEKGLNAITNGERGTLFLDEVSILPLQLQKEALSLLKDSPKNGFRIIASTKKDLEKMVEEGTFIRELYYRLNVLPIYIPPLRQRAEEILPFAEYFLNKTAFDIKHCFEGFTPKAVTALTGAYWPGNIRELRNCIEQACMTASGTLLDENALFMQHSVWNIKGVGEGERNLKIVLEAFKAAFIERVLLENKWNQTVTAKILGIQRTYLSKLIKDLQINKRLEHK